MYVPPTQSAMACKEAPVTDLVVHLLSEKACKSHIRPWDKQVAIASAKQSGGGQALSPSLSLSWIC